MAHDVIGLTSDLSSQRTIALHHRGAVERLSISRLSI
jgi:hypothetical protein